jgi:sugar lactone lactonase YvrE
MIINQHAHFFAGGDLNRPECVVAHRSGWLFAPCWNDPGGVSAISPDGRVSNILAEAHDDGIDMPLRPNGIALEEGGTFVIAHMGPQRGGVYRLTPEGRVTCITDRVGEELMLPVNYAVGDSHGRYWLTVSTSKVPRMKDYRPDARSGYVAVHEHGKTRIVADGLGYTNECLLSQDERTLWVNETFARRLTAFDVTEEGLTNRRTLAQFGHGTFPDGLTETVDGSILVTSIVSNRILQVSSDGHVEILLEDVDPGHLEVVERIFQDGKMDSSHLGEVRSRRLENISNIAFGGDDLRTIYLGCLLGDRLSAFRSDLAGRPLPHWNVDISPLISRLEA